MGMQSKYTVYPSINLVKYTPVRKSVTIIHLASFIQGTATSAFIVKTGFNLLNGELNSTCHLLALLGAHHILHVSRI